MAESREMVEVHGVLGHVGYDVAEELLKQLIREEKLPYDFQFRLLMVDREERSTVMKADILAALGRGEPSGNTYLTDAYPDTLFVPVGPRRPILAAIDEDYHMLRDMEEIAWRRKEPEYLARTAWADYVRELNPELASWVSQFRDRAGPRSELMSKEARYWEAMRGVIIKDVALMGLYRRRLHGHGAARQTLLEELLLDNHPELLA